MCPQLACVSTGMHSPWEQVKAWCYYESRLLGAHHGLISTYALETMVLYIFNLYHTQLHSPLRVRACAVVLPECGGSWLPAEVCKA